jgi:hypothetical protein
MQVKLTDPAVPMFFLGDPRDLAVSLTLYEPGPVEVDPDKLDKVYHQKLLVAIKNRVISSDIPFEELYSAFLTKYPPVGPTPEQTAEAQKAAMLIQARLRRDTRMKEQEDKLQERCLFLHKQGIIAMKSSLKEEKDLRVFRTLLHMEEAEKKRKGTLAYLHKKIHQIELEIIKRAEKDAADQLKTVKGPDSLAEKFTVVESERKAVYLNAKEIINAAYGRK